MFLTHPNLKSFPGLDNVMFIKDNDSLTIGYLMVCSDKSLAVLNHNGDLVTYVGFVNNLLVPIEEIVSLLTNPRQPQSTDGWESLEDQDEDQDDIFH